MTARRHPQPAAGLSMFPKPPPRERRRGRRFLVLTGLILTTLFMAALRSGPAVREAPTWTTRLDLPYLRGAVLGGELRLPAKGIHEPESGVSQLKRLARLGCDSIVLRAVGLQSDAQTPFIASTFDSQWASGDAQLERTVQEAHRLGMRVLLQPRLLLQNGQWAGEIGMRDERAWDKWFEEYGRWLRHYATLAERWKVDLFCVGVELAQTTRRTEDWRRIIAATRQEFSGPIFYAANWAGELEAISFWDELDLIGLQAYAPLLDSEGDSLAQGAERQAQRLRAIASRQHKPAIVSELGYRSVADCAVHPWAPENPSQPISLHAQRAAMHAMISAFSDAPWFRGFFWYGGEPPADRAAYDPATDRSQAFFGKPAEDELRELWRSPPLGWAAHRVLGRGGVVVSGDSTATRVGLEVLRDGGNAVDAAVAAALTMAVSYPEAGNLGGGGFLIYYEPDTERSWALDFRERAPAAVREDLYVNLARQGIEDASTMGPLAAGIPGSPAGLHAAWARAGDLSWERLVRPAFELAVNGFPIGRRFAARILEARERLERFESSRQLFLPQGRPLGEGEILRQPELAATLRALMREGPGVFYHGWVARNLVQGVRAAGGLWTLEDLAGYRPRFFSPTKISLGADDRTVLLTMPPPSSAGVVLGQSWDLLRRQGLGPGEHDRRLRPEDPLRARAFVEALRLSFADRNEHLGEPDAMEVTAEDLLAPSYLRRRARLLPRPGRIGNSDQVTAGRPSHRRSRRNRPGRGRSDSGRSDVGRSDSGLSGLGSSGLGPTGLGPTGLGPAGLGPSGLGAPRLGLSGDRSPERDGPDDTTHLVVIDREGRCVSLTYTLNDLFGCGFIEPQTGVLLNNEMDDFDTQPGKPNLYGLIGTGVNKVRSGARMLSSMSPSIVLRDDQVWFALGGRGGSPILTAVLQVLFNRVVDGMPLDRALSAPRLHHQWRPDQVYLEEGRAWPGLAEALGEMGYDVQQWKKPGKLNAAEQMGDGWFVGVADPREGGLAGTVE